MLQEFVPKNMPLNQFPWPIMKCRFRLHTNNLTHFCFFPTCQVRVVRFCKSSSSTPPSSLPSPPPCPFSRQSLRQSPRQVPRQYLRKLLPAPDRSGNRRASTASSRSQWALPDLNCQKEERQNICQNIRQIECQKICQLECQMTCQMTCQIVCQKKCQIELLKKALTHQKMPNKMGDDLPEDVPASFQIECQ